MPRRDKAPCKQWSEPLDYADTQHYHKSPPLVNNGSSLYSDTSIKINRRPLRGFSRRSTLVTSVFDPCPFQDQHILEARCQSDKHRPRTPEGTFQVDVSEKKHCYNAICGEDTDPYYAHNQKWDNRYFEDYHSSGRGSLYDLDRKIERYRSKTMPLVEGNHMHSENTSLGRSPNYSAHQKNNTPMFRRGRAPTDYPMKSAPEASNRSRVTFETSPHSYSTLEEVREPIYIMARYVCGNEIYLIIKIQPCMIQGEQMSWAGLFGGDEEEKHFIETDDSRKYWLGFGARGSTDIEAVKNLFEVLKSMYTKRFGY